MQLDTGVRIRDLRVSMTRWEAVVAELLEAHGPDSLCTQPQTTDTVSKWKRELTAKVVVSDLHMSTHTHTCTHMLFNFLKNLLLL